ncbi:MAG: TlpA disulfide reductase family protein [Deltaproteobacteria bacterium]|nr:TlpA disulfide reductase family protein [Deltaproteobacteria bacterium]
MLKRIILFLLIFLPILYLVAVQYDQYQHEKTEAMVGEKAPDFKLQTLDGQTVTLDSFKGAPLVINFWATWCAPCLIEHPVFMNSRIKFPTNLPNYIGVVFNDDKENVEAYIQKYNAPYQILFDPEGEMARDYGVIGVPLTIFIDRNGIIREQHRGIITEGTLEEKLKKAL